MQIEQAESGSELHESQLVVHLLIVVGVEADLVDVERLRPIDITDRHEHDLEFPIHGTSSPSAGRPPLDRPLPSS